MWCYFDVLDWRTFSRARSHVYLSNSQFVDISQGFPRKFLYRATLNACDKSYLSIHIRHLQFNAILEGLNFSIYHMIKGHYSAPLSYQILITYFIDGQIAATLSVIIFNSSYVTSFRAGKELAAKMTWFDKISETRYRYTTHVRVI